jgi:YD repeat-containing protein
MTDGLGRVTATIVNFHTGNSTQPDQDLTTSTVLDLGGRLVTIHDPRGTAYDVSYSYDGLDRLTTTAATKLTATIGATYDALGERLSLSDGTGSTAFQYDALGRVTQVTAPVTGVVGYGYDPNGNRTSLTYPNGTQLGYQYVADGQLQNVTQSATTLAAYGYDAAGRVQTIGRSNGTVTAYSYDGADRVTDLRTTVGTSLRSDFAYQPDRLGQTTALSETLALATGGTSTRTIAYGYDGVQRLSGAVESPGTSYGYRYDLAGNRTGGTVNGTPAAGHRVELPRCSGEDGTGRSGE